MLREYALTLIVVTAGCSPWSTPLDEAPDLPLPRMSTDTVVVETAFVDLDANAAELEQRVWLEADEQRLSNESRRQLAARGFRCGVVGSPLPESLRALHARTRNSVELPRGSSVISMEDVVAQQRRMQLRNDRQREIAMPDGPRETIAVPFELFSGSSPVGDEPSKVEDEPTERSLTDAACAFAVQSTTLEDGRVRVELTPTIKYGVARTRWVGDHLQATWSWTSEKPCLVMKDLTIAVTLHPGETLMIGDVPSQLSFGRNFLANERRRRKLFLLRLAQTQKDGVFDDHRETRPLASTP